jgi:hypothetical protein
MILLLSTEFQIKITKCNTLRDNGIDLTVKNRLWCQICGSHVDICAFNSFTILFVFNQLMCFFSSSASLTIRARQVQDCWIWTRTRSGSRPGRTDGL